MTGGCTCSRTSRRWSADAPCAGCGAWPLESQLTPVLLQILCAAGSGLVLWRNQSGYDRERRVRYGVGNPGGGDYIGVARGRYVEVEFKTHSGRQSKDQVAHQALVERAGGIYAVVRSETEARALLERLAVVG